jgi:hypothetical protein
MEFLGITQVSTWGGTAVGRFLKKDHCYSFRGCIEIINPCWRSLKLFPNGPDSYLWYPQYEYLWIYVRINWSRVGDITRSYPLLGFKLQGFSAVQHLPSQQPGNRSFPQNPFRVYQFTHGWIDQDLNIMIGSVSTSWNPTCILSIH